MPNIPRRTVPHIHLNKSYILSNCICVFAEEVKICFSRELMSLLIIGMAKLFSGESLIAALSFFNSWSNISTLWLSAFKAAVSICSGFICSIALTISFCALSIVFNLFTRSSYSKPICARLVCISIMEVAPFNGLISAFINNIPAVVPAIIIINTENIDLTLFFKVSFMRYPQRSRSSFVLCHYIYYMTTQL